jgi:hypothetical protein
MYDKYLFKKWPEHFYSLDLMTRLTMRFSTKVLTVLTVVYATIMIIPPAIGNETLSFWIPPILGSTLPLISWYVIKLEHRGDQSEEQSVIGGA